LVADLHRVSAVGVPDRLVDRCTEMFERIGLRQARPEVRAHVPDAMWEGAVRDCRALLSAAPREVVLHGDLHLGNVLDGGARGPMVIDPKLCVGDPCFDLVDYVVADGGPAAMRGRAAALAPLVGIPLDHLLRWSRVNAVVSAVSRTAWSGPDERTRTLLSFATLGV
jgi:streptomycin 6-kinase